MNGIKQSLGLVFTFLLLIVSARYYMDLETPTRLDDNTLSSTVDMTVSQLRVRQFNAQGILTNQLTAPLMEHIPKENMHIFQTPHIIITQDEQPSWEINAQIAKSFQGGERIMFMNDVIVHQNEGKKTQPSTLKTEEITYYPQEKRASTNLFVTFEQPGNKIESMGMNAYLDEKRVELLHQARGSYAPLKG